MFKKNADLAEVGSPYEVPREVYCGDENSIFWGIIFCVEHYMNVVVYRILTALFVISDSFYPLSRHETNWTSKLALIKSFFAHHTSKLTIQCNPFPTGVYEKHFSPHTLH